MSKATRRGEFSNGNTLTLGTTLFCLLYQYNMRPVVPLEEIRRDYFPQFADEAKLIAKIRAGDINLPLVRLGPGQKAARGVALIDLAAYLDAQISAARQDMQAMTR
jgi:hypothetical protein